MDDEKLSMLLSLGRKLLMLLLKLLLLLTIVLVLMVDFVVEVAEEFCFKHFLCLRRFLIFIETGELEGT
jgi:hypothetical protein